MIDDPPMTGLECEATVEEHAQGDSTVAELDAVTVEVTAGAEPPVSVDVTVTAALVNDFLINAKCQRYVYFTFRRFHGRRIQWLGMLILL